MAGLVLLAGGLAGCVPTEGGTLGDLTRTAQSATSGLQSARLAFESWADGRSTFAVADTALSDSLTELTGAQSSVEELDVTTGTERRSRAEAIGELGAGASAIVSARETIAHTAGAPAETTVRSALKASAGRLQRLSTTLGRLW